MPRQRILETIFLLENVQDLPDYTQLSRLTCGADTFVVDAPSGSWTNCWPLFVQQISCSSSLSAHVKTPSCVSITRVIIKIFIQFNIIIVQADWLPIMLYTLGTDRYFIEIAQRPFAENLTQSVSNLATAIFVMQNELKKFGRLIFTRKNVTRALW